MLRNRKLGLFFTILGFLVTLFGFLNTDLNLDTPYIDIIKYLGILMLILGVIIAFKSSSPYSELVSSSDWTPIEKEHFIDIPYSKHKKKHPKCEVLMKNDSGYEVVTSDIIISENDDVRIVVGHTLIKGKIIIK